MDEKSPFQSRYNKSGFRSDHDLMNEDFAKSQDVTKHGKRMTPSKRANLIKTSMDDNTRNGIESIKDGIRHELALLDGVKAKNQSRNDKGRNIVKGENKTDNISPKQDISTMKNENNLIIPRPADDA